jgi:undecaprenyl-diphosphatase
VLAAIIWGLVQGLTEFLPISSSGHLVLVPAFLTALGLEVAEPSLLVSAVLHLGTLLAVLVYFRADLLRLLKFRTDAEARRMWLLLLVGSIPVLVAFPLQDTVERLQDDPDIIGTALILTGVVLLVGRRLAYGEKTLEEAKPLHAFLIGVSQAAALLPGLSRSGSTIVTGQAVGLKPAEAARYSFLLGVPTIAGGGLLSLLEISEQASLDASLVVGLVVSAVSGYAAIAFLLAALRRVGLMPFAIYALAVGAAAILLL